jgi:flavin reductase (DIM6/NTAB) family NADH-FMN oxidoreductase RutF
LEANALSTPLQASGFNPRDFRNALGRFASGVTVITVHHEDHTHGMTANAFTSVSLEPPLVLVSLDNRSNMHRILPEARRYGVSVLAEDQEVLSNHFAGKPVAGLQAGFTMHDGIPLLDGAVATLIVEVTEIHPAGDHTLYLGLVTHLEWNEGRPLLFYAGHYHHLRAHRGEWGEPESSLFSIGGFNPER